MKTFCRLTAIVLLFLASQLNQANAAAVQVLHTFTGDPDGAQPEATLIGGIDSNFYGTAFAGGPGNRGTIFRITPSGTFHSLYTFTGADDGGNPMAGLIQASDSNFYGTASTGGLGGDGILYRVNSSGAFTILYIFSGANGAQPQGGLVQGSDGDFYGTTFAGGSAGSGTVFKITSSGVLTMLHHFSGADGINPMASLIQGSDGNFYGTTFAGGSTGSGTVFRITSLGVFMTLHSFSSRTDGAGPIAGLVEGSDGDFYGTTYSGGAFGAGTVFKVSSTQTFTKLHDFTGGRDGGGPKATLALGSDGNFYGTTFAGGDSRLGSIFRITTKGVLTSLYSFNGGSAGKFPQAALVEGSESNFYGLASAGGAYNMGTLFTLGQPAAGGCRFAVSPKNAKFKTAGGSATVKVSPNMTNCDWTAVSNDPFITITAGTNGVGKGTVSYTIPSNSDTVAFSGTMTIAGQTFTVMQAAVPCEFSLDETNASFGATGGFGNLMVTANGTNCTWKAVASGSFIKITSGASGAGDGTVDYTVEANTKPATSKGTITVGKAKLTITESGTL